MLAVGASLGDRRTDLGPRPRRAGDELGRRPTRAGAVVWVSNNIAFALLYWELEGGGGARARNGEAPRRSPAAAQSSARLAGLATAVHRLPLPRLPTRPRSVPPTSCRSSRGRRSRWCLASRQQKRPFCWSSLKPSDGLEPSTASYHFTSNPSLPSRCVREDRSGRAARGRRRR